MGKKKEATLFPETQEILAILSKESPQDIVVVAIPSHDRKNKPLAEALVGEWASNAMQLLADLYRGATAYKTFKGIFKTDEGHYLWDTPILIEAYALIEAIQDPQRLNLLVEFAKRMGKTLDQASIMLVFGTVMYYIEDYSGV
ncbi:MAG TPA: hypothetical protein VIL86_03475 [Tepidisphaeraceae bacterium]